jgi:predicted nucleic acid-binding Zn ribbon protein
MADGGPADDGADLGAGGESAGERAEPAPGVDLARAMLAQARDRARAQGRARPARRREVREPRRSGAGPDARDPQPFGTGIERLVAERGWQSELAVAGAIGRWGEIVGAEIAAHTSPESFADGVLRVRTDSTAWATQLRLLAPQLLAALNAELGHGTVTRIDVAGPAAPSWRKGPRSVRGGRGPRDTYG